jgi:hypothetical protein
MKPLELIFALLRRFIDFKPGRISKLEDEAANWETKIRDGEDSPLKKLVTKCDEWYIQIALAILFLFGVKYIGQWLMNDSPADVLEDDEFEDEDDAPAAPRKFSLNN